MAKKINQVNYIIVHCAATPEGKAFTVKDIDKWHRANGWRCCGYHYVVHLDGSVHVGRPENEVGAHCSGKNSVSVGVCYIGGCGKDGKTAKDTRTPEQKKALLQLLKELKGRYPHAQIRGHRDFSSKPCPSFDATQEYCDL